LCGGKLVAEDDSIPGLDLDRLRADARDEMLALRRLV
jgi:hypothetical protein